MNFYKKLSDFKINEKEFIRLYVAGHPVGLINERNVKYLIDFPEVFQFSEEKLCISEKLSSVKDRSMAVNNVMKTLFQRGLFKVWRDEQVTVAPAFGGDPLLTVERGASLFLGFEGYGVFLNGYTYIDDQLHMWIAKRSSKKKTYPGKYDLLVGGGISEGLNPVETLLKESNEEAGMVQSLITKAMPVGTISYARKDANECAERATMFNYDLLLPVNFKPTPIDGEVESFDLLPIERVVRMVESTDDFKDNCNLVLIDFFVRRGLIDFSYPGYTNIISSLHE